MMKQKYITGLVLLTLLVLSGCSRPPTLVDDFYGTSYELALQSQILDPQAGTDPQPVEGIDGEIGRRVVERYQKGIEQPAAQTENYSVIFEGMSQK